MSDFDIEIIPKKSKKKSVKKEKTTLIESRNKTKKKENEKTALKNKPKIKVNKSEGNNKSLINASKSTNATNSGSKNKKLTITELIRATRPKPISNSQPLVKSKSSTKVISKSNPKVVAEEKLEAKKSKRSPKESVRKSDSSLNSLPRSVLIIK